jgi:ABC-type glycerol-3-phosphate transport system substrate-binding protein
MLKYLSAAVLGLAACASGAEAQLGANLTTTATSFNLAEANKNAWLSAAGDNIYICICRNVCIYAVAKYC